MKRILIDCTLTGGRGPAKKTAEFVWECQRLNIPYTLIADKKLVEILKDFNIKPDYVIPIDFALSNKEIYTLFEKQLSLIEYDVLVKFGARTPGPYVAKKQGKPYLIVDGGLPDKYEAYPSMYDRDTYKDAKAYIITSNFPWIPTVPLFLSNVKVAYFPISQPSREFLKEIGTMSKQELLKKYSKYFTPFSNDSEFIINLSITNDYVDIKSRVTYGAWLKASEYDQSVGFVRRLITDLGVTNKKIDLITDTEIAKVAGDILCKYTNINIVTWENNWNYQAEIVLEKIADITISRAANYQPFIFAIGRGNNVTSAVPANSYMDEDNAAIQAQSLLLTENIIYDDENYVNRLMVFITDKKKRELFSNNQKRNFETFGKENNSLTLLLNFINSL